MMMPTPQMLMLLLITALVMRHTLANAQVACPFSQQQRKPGYTQRQLDFRGLGGPVVKDFSDRFEVSQTAASTPRLEMLIGFYQHGLLYFSDKDAVKNTTWSSYENAPFTIFYSPFQDLEQQTEFTRPIAMFQKELVDYRATYVDEKPSNTVYFTMYGFGHSHEVMALEGIYAAQIRGEVDWVQIAKVPLVGGEYHATHPFITDDGMTLIFVSDVKGGYGGDDLYMCRMTEQGWSIPINLGPQINGVSNEMFPFLHEDGTLYFASDRQGGVGGLDIYEVPLALSPGVHEVYHMGIPVNSPKDDFMLLLSPDKRTGYLTSDRKGSQGYDDIYKLKVIEMPNNRLLAADERPIAAQRWIRLDGKVVNAESGIAVKSAIVKLLDPFTGFSEIYTTKEDGLYSFVIDSDVAYVLSAHALGYGSDTQVQVLMRDQAVARSYIKLPLLPRNKIMVITGEVVCSSSHTPIPESKIWIEDVSANQTWELSVDPSGNFKHEFLPTHQYHVKVSAAGFAPYSFNLHPAAMSKSDEIHYFIPLRPKS